MWNKDHRRREMGLGGFPAVSLAMAREKAQVARELIAQDKDPLYQKKKTVMKSFGEAADHLVETLKADWKMKNTANNGFEQSLITVNPSAISQSTI